MSPYLEKYKKNIVLDMRRKGYSYSEIQNAMHIPKSTIAYWLRDVKLTPEQSEKLKNKQYETIRVNSEKRKKKTSELIEEIKNNSSKEIGKISKREFWLMGLMLYWRERLLMGNEADLRKGVRFTSSDPYLIRLFLKWLKEVGGITDDEIALDIFMYKFSRTKKISDEERINKIKEVISFWAGVTEFPKASFSRIYFKKRQSQNNNRSDRLQKKEENVHNVSNEESKNNREPKRSNLGLLRIRVRASSMLARQISGWVKGIKENYWDE